MKHLLICLLLALPTLVFAQSNFLPGYVITNSKDSINGYIDYKERSSNPTIVNFKPTLAGNVRIYSTTDCMAFGIADHESYKRFVVNISLSSVDVNQLTVGVDASSKRDTVFLNVIQAGKNVVLYAYKDKIKTRYYIKEKGTSEPIELVQQQYFKDLASKRVVNDDYYIIQLFEIIQKYKAISPEDQLNIQNAKYTKASLAEIAASINGQEVVNLKSKGAFRFYVGAGVNLNSTRFLHSDYEDGGTNSSTMPLFAIGIDLIPNAATGKTLFRFEGSYLQSKANISNTIHEVGRSKLNYIYKESAIYISPKFIYNVFNTNTVKAYLGAGLGLNLSKYNATITELNPVGNTTTVTQHKESYNSILYSLNAGVVVMKRVELALSYTIPYVAQVPQAASIYIYDIHVQRISAGVNILFGKK